MGDRQGANNRLWPSGDELAMELLAMQMLVSSPSSFCDINPRKIMSAYSTVERAFQLARSGECKSIETLRAMLAHEGYSNAVAQTSFPLVRKQLLDLMLGRTVTTPRKVERARKRNPLNLHFERA